MKSLLPLIKAISSGKQNLDIGDIDRHLFEYIIDSGLASYLNYSIIKTENIYHSILMSAELTAKIITNTQIQAIQVITDAAAGKIGDITLLKGISLCQNYYPSPHFRIMSDIDILILDKDISSLNEVLIKLGYKQTSEKPDDYYDAHHHDMPYYNKENNVWIEVHTHLFSNMTPVFNDKLFSLENIRENRLNMDSEKFGDKVKYICPELQLIYTCVHWAEDYNAYKSGIQFTDIILLVKNKGNGLDWNKIHNWLDNTASASSVYLALSYLHKSGLLELPDSRFKKITLKNKNMFFINRFLLYKIIDKYMIKGVRYGKVLNEKNIIIIWDTLLQPSPSTINLISLPWNIIFPSNKKNRYHIKHIYNRVRNLYKRIMHE